MDKIEVESGQRALSRVPVKSNLHKEDKVAQAKARCPLALLDTNQVTPTKTGRVLIKVSTFDFQKQENTKCRMRFYAFHCKIRKLLQDYNIASLL